MAGKGNRPMKPLRSRLMPRQFRGRGRRIQENRRSDARRLPLARKINKPRGKTLSLRPRAHTKNASQKAAAPKRLKVRNIDEKEVSNADLKKLFEKVGKLVKC